MKISKKAISPQSAAWSIRAESARVPRRLEQFCDSGPTFTYNSPDQHSGGITYGGYSKSIVVDQDFVLRLSDKLDLAATAPLLCAGITTYSPLRKLKVARAKRSAWSGSAVSATWR